MGSKKLKKERPVFGGTRKPTAPPSKKMGEDRIEEKVHPARRRSKHKTKLDTED